MLLQKPQNGVEDFACYAERVPGFYFMLGVRMSLGITEMLHTPAIRCGTEACLSVGVQLPTSSLVLECSRVRASQLVVLY